MLANFFINWFIFWMSISKIYDFCFLYFWHISYLCSVTHTNNFHLTKFAINLHFDIRSHRVEFLSFKELCNVLGCYFDSW